MSADAQSTPEAGHVANAKPQNRRLHSVTNMGWLHGAIFALSLTSLVPGVAIAQTTTAQATPAPATPSGPDADNKREEVVVEGVPPAENIMPTARPTQSVYGLDLGVMETPRNTTILSK
jgi:hypothetical protein